MDLSSEAHQQQQYVSQPQDPNHHLHHHHQQAYDAYYAMAYPQQYYSQPYYQHPDTAVGPVGTMQINPTVEMQWHDNGAQPPPPGMEHYFQYRQGTAGHSGGSGRGRGSFRGRGGGRGNSRGRGQLGRGGGRKTNKIGPEPQSAHTSSTTEPAVLGTCQASPALSTRARPAKPVLPKAWCDVCRVECTGLDILEQHKNGKRHKKTVKRVEERQKQQGLSNELQAEVKLVAPNVAEQEQPLVSAENAQAANLKVEEQMTHTAEGQLEPVKVEAAIEALPSVAPLAKADTEASAGQPNKRKTTTKTGRGGKRLKSSERGRFVASQKEQARVCTLCNAKCDTLAVFDKHLSGKKHLSKMKKFQGQGVVFGPITVYIPPNQPVTIETNGQDPVFYGLKNPEMLQIEASLPPNGLQLANYEIQPQNGAQQTNNHFQGEVDALKEFKEDVTLNNAESQHNDVFDSEAKDPSVNPILLASETAIAEGEITPLPELGAPQAKVEECS